MSNAGFRQIGPNPYQTEVIRTSVNRGDISFSVHALPRNKTTSFEALYFLVSRAVDDDGVSTPERIPKAVVFVDSRVGVGEAACQPSYHHNTYHCNRNGARARHSAGRRAPPLRAGSLPTDTPLPAVHL